ncbi:MAG TPA: hypothetical protein VHX39_01770 [Acetobacteraceae bacterium]|nr:hypothetical protein [Acetobacteraceae bacterium]
MIDEQSADGFQSSVTVNELRRWSLLAAGIAYWANVVRSDEHASTFSILSAANSFLSDGAFNIVAWILIATWAWRGIVSAGPATVRQVVATLALGLLSAVPTRQTTIVGLSILGIILAMSARTRYGRPIAALTIGLALEMVWTSTYMLPVHHAVAIVDAETSGTILRLFGQAGYGQNNLLINDSTDFRIEILAACASSFPIAGVSMAFLVVMLQWGRFPRFRDWPWMTSSLLASVALTEIRLSVMSLGYGYYHWLHDGDGATVYVLSATILAVLFPILAIRSTLRTEALA